MTLQVYRYETVVEIIQEINKLHKTFSINSQEFLNCNLKKTINKIATKNGINQEFQNLINKYKSELLNKLTIKNEKGETIINPDRIKEDEYVLKSRTFYTEEGGDAEWLIKEVDATGVTTLLKYYVDSIFQLAGIPNTADLAFNSADLNASAIDRKFYVMNMKTQDIVSNLKKALLRRFELIFNRINYKKGTKYEIELKDNEISSLKSKLSTKDKIF